MTGLDGTDDAGGDGVGDARRDRFAGELDEVVIVHPGDLFIPPADAVALKRLVNGSAS